MDSLEYEDTKKWIKSFLLIILLLSIPTLLVPKIAFSVNQRFFSGILNHPQAFGMTAAAAGAIYIGQIFFQNKSKLLPVVIIIFCISLILVSGSRTAGMALFSAVIISSLLFSMLIIRNIKLINFNKVKLIIILISFLLIIISIPSILDLTNIFMTKTEKIAADSIISAFKTSRAVLYGPIINNIIENPIKGIGFGLASDWLFMDIKYFIGIPVSAPVEKGVLPLAVLEEVGVFGLVFFIVWILLLVRCSIANGFSDTIVLLTILLFNLGEAGLFSANGYGMLYLVLLTSATTKPKLIKNTN